MGDAIERGKTLADAQVRRVDWFRDWAGFIQQMAIDTAANAARTQGKATPIGFLANDLVDRLQVGTATNDRTFKPVTPSTALLATTDRVIAHALRSDKWIGRESQRKQLKWRSNSCPSGSPMPRWCCWTSARTTACSRSRNRYRVASSTSSTCASISARSAPLSLPAVCSALAGRLTPT